jgi:hypothetical protein
MTPRPVGYSTGALAPGDVPRAVALLRGGRARAIELSALRLAELDPLLAALPSLDLSGFQYVSVHAPSRFAASDEARLADRLASLAPRGFPIVIHPDAIHDFAVWRRLGPALAIENMDRRKPIGRTVLELGRVFDRLPEASFCFDVGHAHQVDRTMNDAYHLLRELSVRLTQVHVSEVSTRGRHDPLSRSAVAAFRKVAALVPPGVPILVEVPASTIAGTEAQMALADEALSLADREPPRTPPLPCPPNPEC